jgi:DNA-binding transcriptional ArsR family regulator
MKRDMELIRKILLTIEETDDYPIYNLDIEGYRPSVVEYHCSILFDAGLVYDYINICGLGDDDECEFGISRLTWEGHEFLETAKDDSRWKKAMEVVKEKGGNITLDILKQLLIQLMKTTFLG